VPHALNAHLPEDVVVRSAAEVPETFHPIRDALWKHYRYSLHLGELPDPFDRRYVHRVARPLDVEAMRRAAAALRGRHDFAGFQKSGSPRDTTVRNLRQLDVEQTPDYIHLHFVADGFLYGMARNLAGTLLRAGQGGLDPESIPSHLARVTRDIAGPALPARGLCLLEVVYADPNRGTV
jgi:tRNA pseudouridine38-40 synthase